MIAVPFFDTAHVAHVGLMKMKSDVCSCPLGHSFIRKTNLLGPQQIAPAHANGEQEQSPIL